jgi:hypothetical protein
MKRFLITVNIFYSIFAFGQSLTDKYLHFQTDFYWDTVLYSSEQDFFFERSNGKLIRTAYPVLQYTFSEEVKGYPDSVIHTYERINSSQYPYKYVRKRNSIYLVYFDLGIKRSQWCKQYSLIAGDTVHSLPDKNTLDSENGITGIGSSTYLGEEKVTINGRQFDTYTFLEDQSGFGHPYYHTQQVYLEQKTLIPVKILTNFYNFYTREKSSYHNVTLFVDSGNSLRDYSEKMTEDLILYKNRDTIWTAKQKEEFLKWFGPDRKQYAECLLKKLDGHISFFFFNQNWYFRRLLINKECE